MFGDVGYITKNRFKMTKKCTVSKNKTIDDTTTKGKTTLTQASWQNFQMFDSLRDILRNFFDARQAYQKLT